MLCVVPSAQRKDSVKETVKRRDAQRREAKKKKNKEKAAAAGSSSQSKAAAAGKADPDGDTVAADGKLVFNFGPEEDHESDGQPSPDNSSDDEFVERMQAMHR